MWVAAGALPRPATPYKLLDRPDLQLKLRVKGLSVTTSSSVNYDPTKKAVVFTQTSASTVGFVSYKAGYSAVRPQKLNDRGTLELLPEEVNVPADPSRKKESLSANEEFILLYCPDPLDKGEIAFEAVDNLFYDGSAFSMYSATASAPKKYYTIDEIKNVITKVKGTSSNGGTTREAMSTDNKIFLQMFDIDPGEGKSSPKLDRSKFKVYSDRLYNLFPGEGYPRPRP